MQGILTRGGYAVVEAEPWRAVELLRDPGEKFAVLITNQPYLFLDFAVSVPVLYIAATPDPEWTAKFAVCRALRKPFHPHELLDLTSQLLEKSEPAAV